MPKKQPKKYIHPAVLTTQYPLILNFHIELFFIFSYGTEDIFLFSLPSDTHCRCLLLALDKLIS